MDIDWTQPLSTIAEQFRRRLVPHVVLHWVGRRVAPRAARARVPAIGAWTIALTSAAVLVVVTLLGRDPLAPVAPAIVLAAATYGLTLYAVDHLAALGTSTLARHFDPLPLSPVAKRETFGWLTWLGPMAQTLLSFAYALIGVIGIWLIDPARPSFGPLGFAPSAGAPIPIYASTYVAIALAGVTLGFGFSYAVVLPIGLARSLRLIPSDLPLSPVDPARTPFVRAGIALTNRASATAAGIIAMCLLTLSALRPLWNATSAAPLYAALAVGIAATTVAFLGPQVVASRVIARKKAALSEFLHGRIDSLWNGNIDDADRLERLAALQHLLLLLERTPNTVLGLASARRYLVGVGSQVGATALGVVPWWEWLPM